MQILFVDSFSYGDAPHMAGVGLIQPCKYASFSSGGSPAIIPGPPGPGQQNALNFGNNGFGQTTLTHVTGTLNTACIGRHYRANDTNLTTPLAPMMRFEGTGTTFVSHVDFHDGANSTTVIMVGVMADGTISVYAGDGTLCGNASFPGALLWNSSGVYTVALRTWIYVELLVNVSAGTWSLYVDDVLLQSGSGASFPNFINQFSLQSFGLESYNVANCYVTDGDRLGPVSVYAFPPNFQSTAQWTPATGTNLSQVSEFGNRAGLNTPDDNTSYVFSSTLGNIDLYGFAAPPCYGKILAVAVNVDASAIVGSPTIDWHAKLRGTLADLGTSGTIPGGYKIQQTCVALNPFDSETWTDADLAEVLFGYELTGATTARVTQFMLEKLVTLRDIPFDCGASSYSF